MHQNSLESYREGTKGAFKNRSQKAFECYYFGHKRLTDRQVLQMLFPGSSDKNLVRPRISGLIQDGVLEECDTRIEGMRKVRVCRVREPGITQDQMSLL